PRPGSYSASRMYSEKSIQPPASATRSRISAASRSLVSSASGGGGGRSRVLASIGDGGARPALLPFAAAVRPRIVSVTLRGHTAVGAGVSGSMQGEGLRGRWALVTGAGKRIGAV